MTTYLVAYRDYLKDLSVSEYADEATAQFVADATPGGFSAHVVRSSDSLRSWGPKLRIGVFNTLAPEGTPPVARFENVDAACRRTFQRIEDAKKTEPPRAAPAATEPTATEATAPVAATNPPDAAPAAAGTTEDTMAAKKQKRTRKASSNGAGKSRPRIPLDAKIEVLVEGNPKRPTGSAHARFALYRTGMKVETFLKNGGTNADLSWDRAHKFIKIVPAS